MRYQWAIFITTSILAFIVFGVFQGFSIVTLTIIVFIGQVSLVWMVVQILKAPHSSQKTFESHFYEDQP